MCADASLEAGISRIKFFRSKTFMEAAANQVATVKTEEVLEKKQLAWTRMVRCLTQLEAHIKRGVAELEKHVKLLETAKARAEKKRKLEADNEALKKSKADLAKRANALANANKPDVDSSWPIFNLPKE
eukprot:11260123-Alexandrium_andersonii.AAC.1